MEEDGIKSKATVIARNMGRKRTPIKKRRCITSGRSIRTDKKNFVYRVGLRCATTTDPSLIFFFIANDEMFCFS
jgi:hypothetical protein